MYVKLAFKSQRSTCLWVSHFITSWPCTELCECGVRGRVWRSNVFCPFCRHFFLEMMAGVEEYERGQARQKSRDFIRLSWVWQAGSLLFFIASGHWTAGWHSLTQLLITLDYTGMRTVYGFLQCAYRFVKTGLLASKGHPLLTSFVNRQDKPCQSSRVDCN